MHPLNKRTTAILVLAVVVIGAAVVAGMKIIRSDDPPLTATTSTTASEPPATKVEPANGASTSPSSWPSTTTVADLPTTTVAPALPSPPYEVAQAVGPNAVAVYARPGDTDPQRTLPASIAVGAEKTARAPLVMLVRSHLKDGWLEVFLPVRPNGSTGFIHENDVTATSHRFRIEVSLGAFHLKAFDGDRTILDAPIAEASDMTPTPGGLYYTTMLLKPPNPNGPYGTYAYGLSGYSDTLTEFAGGDGQLGIHGTNEPQRMGQKVSHGCIRLRNQDIEQLAPVLPVGVPVIVTA